MNTVPDKINRFFLSAFGSLDVQHGGVGNRDIEIILKRLGYYRVLLPESGSLLGWMRRLFAFRRWVTEIPEGAELVCQFPIYARLHQHLVKMLSKKGVKITIILSDIDGVKDGDDKLLEKEMELLRYASAFIAQTPKMKNWISQRFPGIPTSVLGPFDFLTDPVIRRREPGFEIAFAGYLPKSPFLEKLDNIEQLKFHIYGPDPSTRIKSMANCQWHGSFAPDALLYKLDGNFGLIWEGDSISGLEGSIGQYSKLINHHKLSLYILSGLPVIASSLSGSAEFIEHHKIGWLVNDLREIPALIDTISIQEYKNAVENMKPLAVEISQGENLQKALEGK